MDIRSEIEKVIKDNHINRSNCLNVPKPRITRLSRKLNRSLCCMAVIYIGLIWGVDLILSWYAEPKIYRKIECG